MQVIKISVLERCGGVRVRGSVANKSALGGIALDCAVEEVEI